VEERLPIAEFAFPGPLRERLLAAILRGEKTATSSLLAEYEASGEPLPQPGQRAVAVDSAGRRRAVIETTEVRVVALGEVDADFARAEGEGFASVAEWRAAHERFWRSPELCDLLGGEPALDDATPVVAERFRLVRALPG
jgi:uncharacterized protein YhfF